MKPNAWDWRTAVAVTMGGAMLVTTAITESGAGSPPASAGAESIKAVQQALKDKGHDPGTVDGAMGPKTEAALRDYQQKEGLPRVERRVIGHRNLEGFLDRRHADRVTLAHVAGRRPPYASLGA